MRSPIYDDARVIASKNTTNGHYNIGFEIETPLKTIRPLGVTQIDINRDYSANITEIMYITLTIGFGTYLFDIYPYKEELYGYLNMRTLDGVQGGDPKGESNGYRVRKFKVEISELPGTDTDTAANDISMKETLDREKQISLILELINPTIVELSMQQLGGILRNIRTDDSIRALLNIGLSRIDKEDEFKVNKVDVIEGDNADIRAIIDIPHYEYVKDLPLYIQNNCGGVYNTALGHFIQGDCWYVYPKFNTNRFNTTIKHMVVYNLPNNLMPQVENTFELSGDSLKIISTGDTHETDKSDEIQLKYGNGIRYVRGFGFLNGFSSLTKSNATITKEDNMVEYVTNTRKNGLTHAPYAKPHITSNHPKMASIMAARMVRYITFIWENADPDAIVPGMPVRYHHISDESTTDFKEGVVFMVAGIGIPKSNTLLNHEFSINLSVTIIVSR